MNFNELAGYCNNPNRNEGQPDFQLAAEGLGQALSNTYLYVVYKRYNDAVIEDEKLLLIPAARQTEYEAGDAAVQLNMFNASISAMQQAVSNPEQDFIYWFNTIYG